MPACENRSAAPGCGALLLLRASPRPRKRQTAAPAPPRLFRPLDAARLRSQPRLRCFVHWTRSARLQRFQRFQRFHGTPRNPRNQRFQRNHGFTVSPEKHEINDFNEITISRPPNGITKATKPTKTTKCLFCGHFVFFVVYGEIVISLQPLALDKKRAALYTGKEKNGPPRAGRKCDALCRKPKTPSKPSSTR